MPQVLDMPPRPISMFKLTPAQIDLIERLAENDDGVAMADMSYREVVTYQELSTLKLVDLKSVKRRRAAVVLTDAGRAIRARGYFSKKAVVRITDPQMRLLRFLHESPLGIEKGRLFIEIEGSLLDVCRRMSLRGWAEWYEDDGGNRRARLTKDGREIVELLGAAAQ